MSDRFDFLEIDDAPPKPVLPSDPSDGDPAASGNGWKPVRMRAVELIGEYGDKAGQFNTPTSIAVDQWGSLYVVDSNNHRVQRFGMNGDVFIYGRPGSGIGQMWGPQGVTVDPSGQYFWVAEQGNNRVQCFKMSSGQHQVMYSGFKAPSGVVFDAEGLLWVADTGASRVVRINTRTGACVGGFDRAAGIGKPINIAADANTLYITDTSSQDVERYNFSGAKGVALGQHRRLDCPMQTAVDSQGRVYLAESGANRLHVFDPAGYSLLTFDTPSTRLGAFQSPSGVAIGPNGEIYVADTMNHRILRLAWD